MDITLVNYKFFNGKYIIYEKNGKGKEYYVSNDMLIFEGEYFNGKKWNGKYYDINGNIEYEIKNGNGKCKEYNNNGFLIYLLILKLKINF